MFNRMAKIQFFDGQFLLASTVNVIERKTNLELVLDKKTHPYTTFDNIMFDTSYTCILITSQLSEEN